MFKWFTRKKYNVTFYMKSGATIQTTCDKLEINKVGNELTGYTIVGAPQDFLFYVRLADVSAITLE